MQHYTSASGNMKIFSVVKTGQNNRVQVNAPESVCRVIHALRGACLTRSVHSSRCSWAAWQLGMASWRMV